MFLSPPPIMARSSPAGVLFVPAQPFRIYICIASHNNGPLMHIAFLPPQLLFLLMHSVLPPRASRCPGSLALPSVGQPFSYVNRLN